MASATIAAGQIAHHSAAMVAATLDTITFTGDRPRLKLTFTSGTTPIFFTTDNSAPTVGGTASRVLAPVVGQEVFVEPPTAGDAIVKLISSGTPTYSIEQV
jgi:hypothetical protein